MSIPDATTKKFSVNGSGDIFGNICKTKNIDFDNEGYIGLAQKVRAWYREAGTGQDLDAVLAIVFSDVGDLVVTSDGTFEINGNTSSAPLSLNSDSGVQSWGTNGDAIAWNGRIYATSSTTTKYWDGSTWTSASITLTTGHPHPMAIFESLNYLAIATTGNVVKLYNTSHTLIQTLTIPEYYEIQWIVYREQNLYIGTRNTVGGEAKMFIWNGSGTAAQRAYGCGAERFMSGCEYSGSIATMTSLGQLLRFNGGGFDVLENLPVYYSKYYQWTDGNQRMSRRGMVADGKLIYMNLDGHVTNAGHNDSMLSNQPSGVWCYDPDVGLYHKGGYSADYPTFASVTAVNITTDQITLGSAVETATGMPILYSQVTAPIGGINTEQVYYAIMVDSTHVKFAKSYDDAINGVAIDLTSDPGVYSGKLLCPKGADYGMSYHGSLVAGAIVLVPEARSYPTFGVNRLLWGVWRVTDDFTSVDYSGIMSFVPGENRGSFVTTKIATSKVEDMWGRFLGKLRGLLNSNDKAILKYRISEKQFFPLGPKNLQFSDILMTWVSTTQFTTTDALFAYVSAGDEIEIVKGAYAGALCHVSSISVNAGTYTVNIDETFPLISASDTSLGIVDNWTKLGIITSTDAKLHKSFPVDKPSKWIQLKVELRGEDVQFEEAQVSNKNQLTLP